MDIDLDIEELLSDSDEEDFQQLMTIYINLENNGFLKKKPRPQRISKLTGHQYVLELLNGHPMTCFELLRMTPQIFISLCEELKKREKLKDSKFIPVLEQVAMFLLIIAHNSRQRLVADRFQHSLDTVHHHFRRVLYAICSLSKHLIIPPSFEDTPPVIKNNPRYYPIFKNCMGAIDRTHVSARVPLEQQIPYRGKKIEPTMNVMCACSFDMKFTFVMAGWEGTANDSRIFWETITNIEQTKFPMPPLRKYYLIDSGYTKMPGFLSPYRGERYHLRDYRGATKPQGPEEIFNYTHSSLRNVIERCFGVLKARFPILRYMPLYDLKRQKYIVLSCCVIHNFIKMCKDGDPLFIHYADENVELEDDETTPNESEELVTPSVSQSELRRMAKFLDRLAKRLWDRQNPQ
ncbi:protein ALP1-like [Spinacia oleracea]|uniref:Protein ALP1-like n=1 Tax=Spinacia oleracea TaxID=3562 RepID=A0ABM3RSB0_SPIOL|nr:protein ALP1-like [Spinacia oleracea]